MESLNEVKENEIIENKELMENLNEVKENETLNEVKKKKRKKKKKEKKIKTKTIRLSESELKEIKKNAQEHFMNFSQFLIFSSLKKRADIKQQPLFKELVTQIARVGNNLNQITKICNTQKQINSSIVSELIIIIDKLQAQITAINEKLNKC